MHTLQVLHGLVQALHLDDSGHQWTPTASSRHSSPALHATSHQCLQHVHSSQFIGVASVGIKWIQMDSNGFKVTFQLWLNNEFQVDSRNSQLTLSHVFLALGCRQMF